MAHGDANFQLSISQVRDGPLDLSIPKCLKLFQCFNSRRKQLTENAFRGSIEVTNNGNRLVTFKIMSSKSAKLRVQPSHGLIQSKSTVKLILYSRDKSLVDAIKHFKSSGILLLTTTCELNTQTFSFEDLYPFWKNAVAQNESRAFIEVVKIKHFEFYDPSGIMYEDWNPDAKNSPIRAGSKSRRRSRSRRRSQGTMDEFSGTESSRSLSASTYFQTDTGDEESDGSTTRNNAIRRRNYKVTLNQMQKLSNDLGRTQKKVRYWVAYCVFLMIWILLWFVEKNLGNLEFGVFMISREKR